MPWLMTLFSRSEWNLGWRLWVMLSDGYIYIRRGAGSEAYILGICGNGAFSIYFFAI